MAIWSTEQAVTPAQAIRLIAEHFPKLAPVHVSPFGEGWDNSAFRVNGRYVFRFPRRAIAADLLEIEHRVLLKLEPRVTLPVPAPQYLGHSTPAYPWPFSGYRMLEGRTACSLDLTDAQRTALAEPLARFLSSLHSISDETALAWGALPDRIGKLDMARRIPMAFENMQKLRRLRLPVDTQRLYEFLEQTDAMYAPRRAALVHGDFYIRHILIGENGALCGVIDWGDVHRGDPAVDLTIAHSFLPPSAHAAFRAAYGPISEAAWGAARFRALYHSTYLVLYSQDVHDENLLRAGLKSLGFIAAA